MANKSNSFTFPVFQTATQFAFPRMALTGVGRLVESIIAKEVRTMYEGFRPLVEKYIQARRERQMEASLRNSSLAQEMMKSEDDVVVCFILCIRVARGRGGFGIR